MHATWAENRRSATVKPPFSTTGLVAAAAENYRLSFWVEGESESQAPSFALNLNSFMLVNVEPLRVFACGLPS
jgi:hypothetical protein